MSVDGEEPYNPNYDEPIKFNSLGFTVDDIPSSLYINASTLSGVRTFLIAPSINIMGSIYKSENHILTQIPYESNSEIIFDNTNKKMYVDDVSFNYSDLIVSDIHNIHGGEEYFFIENIISVAHTITVQ